jgi:Lrp/AsnC family leucine-responsive transcriptional regulator
MRMMDDIDQQIVTILQENARISNAEISRRIGMVPSGVLERIRKLEERGLLEGYTARVNAKKAGLRLLAFIFVKTDERAGVVGAAKELAEIPEVLEVHHIAGEDCYIAKVRVADTEALSDLIKRKFGRIDTIASTRTTIVLETVKETSLLPINSEHTAFA